jgi:hypothetical protein
MLGLLISLSRSALTDYNPVGLSNLRVLGRTSSEAVHLYWTGSGVEFDFHGTELWVQLEVDWNWGRPWIAVLERDQLIIRQPLEQGQKWYLLFRGLDSAQSHHIKILRETQAWDDPSTSITLTSIRHDGTLEPLPAPACRLEIIGDSYTSGEGSLGTPDDTEWLPIWFSATYNYARLAAQELNADYRILSQSGWGCTSSYDNNPNHVLPKYYEQICGVVDSGKGSNKDPNDFGAWSPDLILVVLGANDEGGFNAGEWSEGGQTFKNTPDIFEQGAYDFLVKLRKLNPNAQLAWMFFTGDSQVLPRVRNAVEKFHQNYDNKATVLTVDRFPATGVRQHPNWETHRAYGKTVAGLIAKVLNIQYNG